MKKSKFNNNGKGYDFFDNYLTQKKEDKNNSSISLQENINNPLLCKSGCSVINMPSEISCKGHIFPSNYPITPIKRSNNLLSSSNKNKNFSSSGLIWNKSKTFNDNSNINNNDNYTKRKLFALNMTPKSNLNQNQNQNFNFALGTFLNNNNENNINNNIPLFTPPKKEIQKEKSEEKNKNENEVKKMDLNINKVGLSNKLFFTDYGLGYKCNCTKTSCNKYYCQCYNQGRYCHECNCQNCQNKIPEYISSNKRPEETEQNQKQKSIIVSCTCTKSGCNKNYCECFKNKTKCNSQCRCRNCENIESDKKETSTYNNQELKYECCEANSVYIIKNKITVEDIPKRDRKIKITINDILSSSSSSEKNIIGKKSKRKELENASNYLSNKKSKKSEENTDENLKGKKNEYSQSDLFDKEGKLILTHIKI